eukprot:2448312-Rhodomonas_salina.1
MSPPLNKHSTLSSAASTPQYAKTFTSSTLSAKCGAVEQGPELALGNTCQVCPRCRGTLTLPTFQD